ncbi:MAG: amidohydrolase family protein [Solirubrobacteraceae bacterium]
MQARQNVVENEFLLALASSSGVVRAVVGWVDLCSPDFDDQIAVWGARAEFVGVRRVLTDEADDRYMQRREFGRVLRALAAANLSYDLLIGPRHVAAALAVVDAHPELRFVLDHGGLPDVRGGGLALWQPGMGPLAGRGNVACKLSGLEYMADWGRWSPQDLLPYQAAMLDAFGPERIMIGSNWPVCTVAGDYGLAVGASINFLEGLSADERGAILGGTCQRWYRFGE